MARNIVVELPLLHVVAAVCPSLLNPLHSCCNWEKASEEYRALATEGRRCCIPFFAGWSSFYLSLAFAFGKHTTLETA